MHIKRNSIFLVDKEKDKPDGKLRYRIKWDGNTVAFSVGYRVDFEKWVNEIQRCKNNTTHGKKKIAANFINKEIGRYEQIAEEIFATYEASGKVPTVDEFRNEFNTQTDRMPVNTDSKSFYEVYDTFTKEVGRTNLWTIATFQKFAALRNHLERFNVNVTFDMFSENGLHSFVEHLRNVLDMRDSTIGKQLGYLKWFLRWASAKGYNKENAYLNFSPKLKSIDKKVIFLDWDELMTVYNFSIPQHKPYLERVRDVFCFCCFTSLRYSDVANLRRSNVYNDHISITTIKTADSLTIELNDYSKEILDKYKHETFDKDLALPVISNQKMNDYLKELGQVCGLDSSVTLTYYKGNQRFDETYPKYALLGTHCGRRTFICNALMLGVTPQIVMKWTGHSDYKAMKPYIDVADKAKGEAMKVFNKKSPVLEKSGD